MTVKLEANVKRFITGLFFFSSMLCLFYLPARADTDMDKSSYSSKEVDFKTTMRRLYSSNLTWLRITAVEIVAGGPDSDKAQARFISSQADINAIFRSYYGDYNGTQISNLFNQYAQLIIDYANATRNRGDKALLVNKMYDKADEIANLLSVANMSWTRDDIAKMIKKYNDSIVSEIDLQGSNPGSIDPAVIDTTSDQSLVVADTFSAGIIKQYSSKFW